MRKKEVRHTGLLAGRRGHHLDTTHVKVTRSDHERFCDYQFDNTGERKKFLQRHNLFKFTQEGIYKLNSTVTMKEIGFLKRLGV